jgi:phenylacetic acid degradation operon negative regulatory protein
MTTHLVNPRTVISALFDADGVAALATVYDVGLRLDIDEQRMRLAIRRQIAAGQVEQHGRGRRGTLTLTAARRHRNAHNSSFIALAYAQDAGLLGWSGEWHLLSLSIPESQRAVRDATRATVTRLGGALLHPGVYISAHDWNAVLATETKQLTILEQATTAVMTRLRIATTDEPRAIAALLWPLDELRAGHEALASLATNAVSKLDALAATSELHGATREVTHENTVAALGIALELAAGFEFAHANDPLLPPELLAEDWPGPHARNEFRRAWRLAHELAGMELFPFLADKTSSRRATGGRGTATPRGPQ